jgi:glutamine cyclotransferase
MKYFLHSLFVVTGIFTFFSCANNDNDGENTSTENITKAKSISYSIIKAYPHDTSSFTQGLVVHKGKLYEGTGGSEYDVSGPKQSKLMQVNLETGKLEKSINIPVKYFGEGITILNDTIYQLTWQEKTVFVYTLPDFKKVKEFAINSDGWGITHNGNELIVSDGSSNLKFYDPATFRLLHTQSVTLNGELVNNINELEYIDGYIYANQWLKPFIFKIDPTSGQVVGQIDLSQIWSRFNSGDLSNTEKVPNGIAYDEATKKIYITGKNWSELYEIQLSQ